MQLKQSNDVNERYKGTIAGLQKIIKDEGLMGLYKGFTLRYLFNLRRCAQTYSISAQCGFPVHVQRILFQYE
jgi:hypothetical protein